MMTVDIAPKKASGAALDVIGIASYIGADIQDILSGNLIGDNKTVVDGITAYDFSSIRYFWIGTAVLSFMLCASLWKKQVKPKRNINNSKTLGSVLFHLSWNLNIPSTTLFSTHVLFPDR
jgi:sugar phosphate permease